MTPHRQYLTIMFSTVAIFIFAASVPRKSAASEPLRFIVVADTQGFSTQIADIVPQLVDDMAARNVAFVLFPGDLVGTGSTSSYAEWIDMTSVFGNNRYAVPGNHDLPGRPATNANWQSSFSWLPGSQIVPNITTADPGDFVNGVDRMDYYVDVAPSVRIISVTTDRDTLPGEEGNWPGNDILGGPPRSLDWFKSVMALDSTKGMDHVFVMTHHPVTAQSGHPDSDEGESTASDWWQAITGASDSFDGAAADAVFSGHVHAYLPNRPDPNAGTAEVIIGTGGGESSATAHRQIHGFMEVLIDHGNVTTTFFGDSNGADDGWSFTEALDTFTIAASGGLPRGEQALYRFEQDEPEQDSSTSSLSKHHALHFNGSGAMVVNDPVRGSVLSLDGQSFVDAKALGDHNFQILGDLRIQLWAKADGPLGNGAIDNMLVAFGDADGAMRTNGSVQDQMLGDEIANYAYQLSYTADGRLRLGWEYREDPTVGASPDAESLVSTEAIADPEQWHLIEVLRDADAMSVRFLVDGVQLGEALSFTHLPTGGGAGSLYLGALPDIDHGNHGGIATFAGRLDDVLISNALASAIPEPASITIMGLGAAIMLRRRNDGRVT